MNNPYESTTVPANVRPYQDPDATDVDLTKYPEPKDSTKKIRGGYELLETLVGGLEPTLVVAKAFYFFFYSAFGSLFPLMGVYFKQLGLNGAQAGILTGIRPLVEYIAAPFWIQFAEKQNKMKSALLASLFCWILFTFPIGSIQPSPVACLIKVNDSHAKIETPDPVDVTFTKRSVPSKITDFYSSFDKTNFYDDTGYDELEGDGENSDVSIISSNPADRYVDDPADMVRIYPKVQRNMILSRERRKRAIPRPIPGMSPIRPTYAIGYDKSTQANYVSPSFSSDVFRKDDVSKVFFLLLLIVIIGEALASPSIVIADMAVLNFLGEQAGTRYGHQRMFGSLGWAVSMFFIGIALDHSTFLNKKCKAMIQEKNYTVCFAIFVVLMGLATLVAWRLQVPEAAPEVPNIELSDPYGGSEFTEVNLEKEKTETQHSILNESGVPQTTVFASTGRKKMPQWVIVLTELKGNINCLYVLFIGWIMGIGIGLIFTFLFWHLQDFGGSPTLFGLASVINHVSEIFAYFFSATFIGQLGHVKVIAIGLLCNVLRFLYISVLKNPWWVLPFELVQGITHSAVWAACSSYLAHNTSGEMRSSTQNVLQGLHHGFGRAFGAIIGGLFVGSMGTTSTFRLYAFICVLTLGGFIFINFYRKDGGGGVGNWGDLSNFNDPHDLLNENGQHLAPHGVPSSPMPRAPSSTRLNESNVQQPQYSQSPQHMPQQQAPTNPFAQPAPDDSQQYFIR